jgi:ribosomal protein L34E
MKKEPKPKKCAICESEFYPRNSLQKVCKWECSTKYAKIKQAQKEKAQKIKELLTNKDYIKLAQNVVNAYIRERDKGLNCISCDKPINGVKHASHYIAAFAHANIRFHEDNIWVSCYKCNVMLSGNQLEYRKRLIKKIGVDRVEWLENNAHIPKKYSIEELKEIIDIYRKKIKELK